jgi:formylglycine-generating enzyme
MTFVSVIGGEFVMGGCATSGLDIEVSEQPARNVRISPFEVQATTVTTREWAEFLEETGYRWGFGDQAGSRSPTGDHPIVFVSWVDGMRFCEWKTAALGKAVRLPTEAEWEWVCRKTLGESEQLGPFTFEFWCEKFGDTNSPVTFFKKPTEYPICGIWQGVSEWCLDSFDEEAYLTLGSQDPVNLRPGKYRVWRGGSPLTTGYPRCSARGFEKPDARGPFLGFRTVISDKIDIKECKRWA